MWIRTIQCAGLAGLLLLAAPLAARAGEAEKTFYRAFYLESALRSFEEAQQAYANASALAADEGDQPLIVQALLGHARCLHALGRFEDARAAFEQVLRLDPQQADAQAALARAGSERVADGVDPELRERMLALVQKLGGPERKDALIDLRKHGEVAVPFLEDGLRSRDVAVVEGCAVLLTEHATRGAVDALIRALADDDVLFPHLLRAGLDDDASTGPLGPEIVRFVEAGMAHADPGVRARLARSFAALIVRDKVPAAHAGVDVVLARIAADPEIEVWQTLLGAGVGRMRALLGDRVAVIMLPLLERVKPEHPESVRRDAIQLAVELARTVPAARSVVMELAADPAPAIRRLALMAMMSASREVADMNDMLSALLERTLASDDEAELRDLALRVLGESRAKWPEALGEAAFTHVAAMLRAENLDAERARGLIGLLSASTTRTFTPEQFAAIYAQLGGVRGPATELVENLRLRILGRTSPHVDPAGQVLDWTDAVAFARPAFASADTSGRRQLLQHGLRDFHRDPDSTMRAVYLEAAAVADPALRAVAYKALVHGTAPAVTALPFLREDVASGDRYALHLLPAQLTVEWEDALWSFIGRAADPSDRGIAIARYAHVAPPAAISRLVALLEGENRDPKVESASLRAAFQLGGERFVEYLVTRASPLEVASTSVLAIDRAWRHRLVVALPASHINEPWMRGLASDLDADAALALMRKGFASPNLPELAGHVLTLAQTIATAEDLPRLLELADHGPLNVRDYANSTLSQVRARLENRASIELFGLEQKAGALRRARELAASSDPVLRRAAALALGALADSAAVPLLLDLVGDADESVRGAALQALEKLGAPAGGGS